MIPSITIAMKVEAAKINDIIMVMMVANRGVVGRDLFLLQPRAIECQLLGLRFVLTYLRMAPLRRQLPSIIQERTVNRLHDNMIINVNNRNNPLWDTMDNL